MTTNPSTTNPKDKEHRGEEITLDPEDDDILDRIWDDEGKRNPPPYVLNGALSKATAGMDSLPDAGETPQGVPPTAETPDVAA